MVQKKATRCFGACRSSQLRTGLDTFQNHTGVPITSSSYFDGSKCAGRRAGVSAAIDSIAHIR